MADTEVSKTSAKACEFDSHHGYVYGVLNRFLTSNAIGVTDWVALILISLMRKITPELKAKARAKLVQWAVNECYLHSSMQEWLENEEVLNFCKKFELDNALLEHIAHWVWKPINRHH